MFKRKDVLPRITGVLFLSMVLAALLSFGVFAPSSVEAASSWPTVSQGAKGNNVVSIQLLLNARGSSLAVDGDFGPKTAAAVKSFQSSHGLKRNGVVNSATWSALIITTKQGSTGSAVTALQKQLKAHGLRLAIDGIFGPETAKAVRQFQHSARIDVDGIAGPQTWNSLVRSKKGSSPPTTNPPSTDPPKHSKNMLIVKYATDIMHGKAVGNWKGGKIPYSWGGGHGKLGPSLGTCKGYTGSIRPCPADKTVGLDCSGFTRWVYYLAYGKDILGPGSTNDQIKHLKHISVKDLVPGDLVFYGSSTTNTHHVGIYIGNGKMINALKTGTVIEVDKLHKDIVGYYAY